MKSLLSILLLFLFVTNTHTQSTCSTYYPFEEGSSFQITNYNKKGKKETVVNYNITNVTETSAMFNTQILDKKGKEITTSNYDIICENDLVSIDFKSMMSPDLFSQYKNIDMDFEGTNIELPNNLSVGQTLKDAEMKMTMNMSGIKMNLGINIINRKVEAQESITTPAGTFDCYVITYDTEMKMGLKRIGKNKEWIAKGVGLVKSENYNKKGKLISYSELTQISN